MGEHHYFVYILTNHSRTLYTGVTSNIEQRVSQHKQKLLAGFTAKYNINHLVWFEDFADVTEAIACEKQIKGWTRLKKVALIESDNPHWEDLSRDWHSSDIGNLSS